MGNQVSGYTLEGPLDVGERGWFPELSREERNAEERPPRVLKKRGKHVIVSHLSDTFIQSDLQMKPIEAIKTNKRAIICKCYDKSQLI